MATKKGMSLVDWLAIGLLIVGGINWGLVGAFGFNLVTKLTGYLTTGGDVITRSVYVLVGLAALYSMYSLSKR